MSFDVSTQNAPRELVQDTADAFFQTRLSRDVVEPARDSLARDQHLGTAFGSVGFPTCAAGRALLHRRCHSRDGSRESSIETASEVVPVMLVPTRVAPSLLFSGALGPAGLTLWMVGGVAFLLVVGGLRHRRDDRPVIYAIDFLLLGCAWNTLALAAGFVLLMSGMRMGP